MSSQSFPENLFATNRAPSDEDHKKLVHLIGEQERRIDILTRQIANLETEKTALVEGLAPLKRAISPFRRLPDDIIRAIFVACLDRMRNPTMAHTEAPVILTRISSYTRRLALASPELWAALHIPIISSSPSNADDEAIMAARVRGIEEWLLRRSGTMALRISVHEPCKYGNPRRADSDNPFTHQVVTVLLQCCTRWRDVNFLLVSIPAVRRIAALTAADCPLLRSVALRGRTTDFHLEADVWKESDIFRGPALQKFSTMLVEPGNGAPVFDFNVNWANVTHLHLHGLYSDRQHAHETAFKHTFTTTMRSILRQATRLVSLNIDIILTAEVGGDIYLPFLKFLKVSEEYVDERHCGVLGQVRAPQLETIMYLGEFLDVPIPPPSLIALLAHATKVQKISIIFIHELDVLSDSDPSAYTPILALCPLLKLLHIGTYSDQIPAISLLCGLAGDTADEGRQLCPELESFHCDSTLIASPRALYSFLKCIQDDLAGRMRWKSLKILVRFRHDDTAPNYAEFQHLPPGIDLQMNVRNMPPPMCVIERRALDEGAMLLSDNWSLPSFPIPLRTRSDCVVDM